MLREGGDGPALFGIISGQLVFYGAVVVAVLQVVIEFRVRQHGLLRAHREQACLLRPVVLQTEVLHKGRYRGVHNGFRQGFLRRLLQESLLLENIHLRCGWCEMC